MSVPASVFGPLSLGNTLCDIRARVERWDSVAPANAGKYGLQQLWAYRRLYLMGVLRARLGELEAAESYARRLDEPEIPPA